MTQSPSEEGGRSAYPRESFRLTFRFSKDRVDLVSQERLEMLTPPDLAGPPAAGENSGTWLELRSSNDVRVAARVLHDPFQTGADLHSPDGRIQHVEREVGEGQFQVLVPAMRDAAYVALVSSELGRAGLESERGAAVEVARFDLERRPRDDQR